MAIPQVPALSGMLRRRRKYPSSPHDPPQLHGEQEEEREWRPKTILNSNWGEPIRRYVLLVVLLLVSPKPFTSTLERPVQGIVTNQAEEFRVLARLFLTIQKGIPAWTP